VFAASRILTLPTMVATLPMAAAGLIALAVGMTFRDRLDEQTYRGWLRRVLFLLSLLLIVQYLV